MIRQFFALCVLLLALTVSSQPVPWRHDVQDTYFAGMARAPEGIYMVTLESTFDSDLVVVHLLSYATGQEIRRFTLAKEPRHFWFELKEVTYEGGRIIVSLQVLDQPTDPGFYGVIAFGNVDGSNCVWTRTLDSIVPKRLKAVGGQLYILGDEVTTNHEFDAAMVEKLDLTSLNGQIEQVYDAVSSGGDMAFGHDGNLYVSGIAKNPAGPVWLVQMDTALAHHYVKSFPLPPNHEIYSEAFMALEPTAHRAYLAFATSEFDYADRAVLYSVDYPSGTAIQPRVFITDLGGGVSGLVADETGAYFGYSGGSGGKLLKVNSTLGTIWSVNTGVSFLCKGSQADLFSGDSGEGPLYAPGARRISRSNGSTLWRVLSNAGQDGDIIGLSPDAAGNVLICGRDGQDTDRSTFVAKYQPASLELASNAVIGGNSTQATINLDAEKSGATLFSLTSNSTKIVVPPSVTIPSGGTMALFSVYCTPVAVNTTATIVAKANGIVLQTTCTALAPVVQTLTVAPNSVFGGVNTSGTVVLTGKAATGGKLVTLSSSKSAATVPSSVTVPSGSASIGFTVITKPVLVNTGVVISATTGAITRTAFMAINAPFLQSLAVTPSSVRGGLPVTVKVTLNAKAPSGYSIQLVSGAPGLVTIPSSVAVTPGWVSQNIGGTTSAVVSPVNVTLIAYRGPYVQTTTLTLTP